MENASKALIIAGAILISILLISIGIIVMNSINKPIEESTSQAESQAIGMFNSKFTGYVGEAVKPSNVKQLINTVISNNATSENKVQVKFDSRVATDSSDVMSAILGEIVLTKTYKVTTKVSTNKGNEGYINYIEIKTNP